MDAIPVGAGRDNRRRSGRKSEALAIGLAKAKGPEPKPTRSRPARPSENRCEQRKNPRMEGAVVKGQGFELDF